jgi:hypothetical protein
MTALVHVQRCSLHRSLGPPWKLAFPSGSPKKEFRCLAKTYVVELRSCSTATPGCTSRNSTVIACRLPTFVEQKRDRRRWAARWPDGAAGWYEGGEARRNYRERRSPLPSSDMLLPRLGRLMPTPAARCAAHPTPGPPTLRALSSSTSVNLHCVVTCVWNHGLGRAFQQSHRRIPSRRVRRCATPSP